MGRQSRTYTLDVIEAAKKSLKRLPEKPKNQQKLNTVMTLESLKTDINVMQSKGYSLDEVIENLRNTGIQVGKTTLKNFLAGGKKPKEPAKAVIASRQTGAIQSAISHDPDEK